MSALPVIVDDQDVTEYSGLWNHQDGLSQEYKGTVSTYPTPGFESGSLGTPSLSTSFDGRFSLSFITRTLDEPAPSGSDIIFYGTLIAGLVANYMIDGGPSRPMELSGNGTVTGLVGAELWRLSLDSIDTHHSLTIFPVTGAFVFDYYTYTPTPNEQDESPRSLIMDDQNPMIKYSSGWTRNTNVTYPNGVPYLRSTTGTNVTGSTMQVTFAVYGTLQQVHGSLFVSFSVDNAPPTLRTLTASQTNSSQWNVSVPLFQQVLIFDEPGQTDHVLLVTLQNVTGAQTLWIDYLILDDTADLTSVGGITPPPNPSSFTPTSSGPRISGRALAGIAVAVVVVVFVLVVGCLRRCLRICRRKPAATEESLPPSAEPKPPTPVPPAPETESPGTQNFPASGTTTLQNVLQRMFDQPQPQTNTENHWDTSSVSSAENTVSPPTFGSPDIRRPYEQGLALGQEQAVRTAHPPPVPPVDTNDAEPRTFVVGEGSVDAGQRMMSTSGLENPAHNPTNEDGRTPVRTARTSTIRPLPPIPGAGPNAYGRR
ncbi:hypothetical protein D9619_010278 [Psilocybe cf. subviscida]|uniref:Transmembrane protein n=1 Tax=Psilocybe cf. subviscida TaxID=2480587 RepID=A0A8H5ASQ1_9AGAR|nr:hypothetical protein D9619_010278 [Psilocybe cf. subviscida]